MQCSEGEQGILRKNQLKKISELLELLQSCSSIEKRCGLLYSLPMSVQFLKKYPLAQNYLQNSSIDAQYVLLSLIALDEADALFEGSESVVNQVDLLQKLVKLLLDVEQFYSSLGGVIGYYLKVLELMYDRMCGDAKKEVVDYLPPPVVDIREPLPLVNAMVEFGLHHLENMAEVYVVGGAGDRLNLIDEQSHEHLPAAKLSFLGHTLLEGLITDLEAREYLYYQRFNKQLITPIVLMTSDEKMNDAHIEAILENARYFGRPKESFFRSVQPLIPIITVDGHFAIKSPLELFVKPGGHGVFWKLANDSGALKWLLAQKRTSILVRQINNPLAGLDYTLLAHCGYGMNHHMAFGFASCERLCGAQEGMNVLRNKSGKICITNLEYTELDQERHQHLKNSDFPANTNILYANIKKIMEAVKILPLPGLLINMKLIVETVRAGQEIALQGARLESTMQNIAEAFDAADCFVTLNRREKTISVTKKSYDQAGDFRDTPESAFYDVISANAKLLKDYCYVEVPHLMGPEHYLQQGPPIIFLYHPALGPLYDIIAKKISGGKLCQGAEMQLQIADATIKNLHLEGSLIIQAERITGSIDPKTGYRSFSDAVGKLRLLNVTVTNAGIDFTHENCYWKNKITRKECCKIILEGNSSFYAEDVHLDGNFECRVPDGMNGYVRVNEDGELQVQFVQMT